MKYLLALLAMLASTLSGTSVQAAPASEEEAYEIASTPIPMAIRWC
mgnify:CR=1 FL=1